MATLADGDASVFSIAIYAPGNPLFPVLPAINAAPRGYEFPIPLHEIAGKSGNTRRIEGPHTRAARLGVSIGGYGDWYKNQWWISPSPLAFGNIVSQKTLVVSLLSTWLDGDHTLDSIDVSALGAGMTVSFPSPTLLSFGDQTTVTFTAAPTGSASFDADTVWTFDNAAITISATGRRVVLIPYVPQSGIQEQLKWVTDIMKSRDGTEQRHSLRVTPRQEIEYTYLQEDGTDASRLRTIMLGIQPLTFGVPIWWEAQQVTASALAGSSNISVNTQNIDHRIAGTIMVLRPDGQAFDAEIDTFDATSITTVGSHPLSIPLGSLVLPVRLAYVLGNPRFSDYQADGLQTTIRFETLDNVDLSIAGSPETGDFPTHNGRVVLSDPNFMIGRTHSGSQQFEYQKIDNLTGVPQQFLQETYGDVLQSKATELNDIAEIRRWRALVHYLRGSWKEFYIPTFRRDVTPISSIQLGDSSFTAYDTGAATYVGAADPHGSLMLELPDGRQFFNDIVSIVDNGDGTELWTISGSWGAVSPDDQISVEDAKISYLRLARMEGDVATFVHEYVGRAQLRFQTRGVQD